MDTRQLQTFRGTSRYRILDMLGQGGMGVVFRALDAEQGGEVALKLLLRTDPAHIYRFKQEFRILADVAHPNLMGLYEMGQHDGSWFLTMELVRGKPFHHHLRSDQMVAATASEISLDSVFGPNVPPSGFDEAVGEEIDIAKLKDALYQLTVGVSALHRLGVLHRDLKPSNVLIEPGGRVVILDFGLALLLLDLPRLIHDAPGAAGTVAYMAPEQAAGLPLTAAADWYSVGVMLYQALTGWLPFSGSARDILLAKAHGAPQFPKRLSSVVPQELQTLCTQLLQREPAQRPDSTEILRCLDRNSSRKKPIASSQRPADARLALAERPRLYGRDDHLTQLGRALLVSRRGGAVVHLSGRSGFGKSALLASFLDELETSGEALVLSSRCYERESIPYKGIDGIVDRLTQYLSGLRPDERQDMLPADAALLAQVFPVLGQLLGPAPELLAEQQAVAPGHELSHTLRRRAAGALRHILNELSSRRPLVLSIDDLQWGDRDSASLLQELLAPPGAPAMLLLLSYRSEDLQTCDILQQLRDRWPVSVSSPSVHLIEVGPLLATDAQALARTVGRQRGIAESHCDAVAEEACGCPYLINELAQALRGEGEWQAPRLSLDQVLLERVEAVPGEARRLLELVSIAGYPLAVEVACAALRIEQKHAAMVPLQAFRLLVSRATEPGAVLEAYHDRVREFITRQVPQDAQKGYHRDLLGVLRAAAKPDHRQLMWHCLCLHENEEASRYALLAAREADAALAFERAVELYRTALRCAPQLLEFVQIQCDFAEALARAGRSGEAAEQFQAAWQRCTGEKALELARRAAEHYLRCGRIDEGHAVMTALLREIGLALPMNSAHALAALLWQRARLRWRGLTSVPLPSSQPPDSVFLRADICRSVALGLSMVDPLRAGLFHTRHLLLALDLGESSRLAQGLIYEAAHLASVGGPSRHRRSRALLTKAATLVDTIDAPEIQALHEFTAGTQAYFATEFRRALRHYEQAEKICQQRRAMSAWQQASIHLFSLWSLAYIGDIDTLRQRLGTALADASALGDLYGTTVLLGLPSIHWLAADQPDLAEAEVERTMSCWTRSGFHYEHSAALISRVLIALYRGRGSAAVELMNHAWPQLRAAHLLRLASYRIELLHLRARSVLLAAAAAPSPGAQARLIGCATRLAAAIGANSLPLSPPRAALVRGAIANLEGDQTRACVELRRAAADFTAQDAHLFAAATQHWLGELGDAVAKQQSTAWMQARQVIRPARFASLLAPGFERAVS